VQTANPSGNSDGLKAREVACTAEWDGNVRRDASITRGGDRGGIDDRDESALRETGVEQTFPDRVAVSGGTAGGYVGGGGEDDQPAGLDAIVQRLLAKSPDDRFQTALELAEVLDQLTAGCDLAALLSSTVQRIATRR
jgi:hypothetical protein